MAKNWSVSVDCEHPAYAPFLEAVAGEIPGELLAELRNDDLSDHSLPQPVLVGPKVLSDRSANVLSALDENLDDGESAAFALSEIRSHLSGCLMFVGWRELLIRPFIPPHPLPRCV